MTPDILAPWLLAGAFALMLVNARRGRNRLSTTLEDAEKRVQALNCENMDLADENKRLNGVINSLAPSVDEVIISRVHADRARGEIERIIRNMGGL